MDEEARKIDPILFLPVHSSVKSLCFISRKDGDPVWRNDVGASRDGDSEDDDCEIKFRSDRLLKGNGNFSCSNNVRSLLNGRLIASCHKDGKAVLWDVKDQKELATISSRDGPGLAIRRTSDPTQLLFQSRDPKGIVSLHSVERMTAINPIRQYETYSRTFCQAASCYGNKNLLALPSLDDSTVTVVDERTDTDVAKIKIEGHGMLTSLAFCTTTCTSDCVGRPILACGMESGTVTFVDLSYCSKLSSGATFSLGKDPLLTLDMMPSLTSSGTSSVIVAAGMAGDSEEVSKLDSAEAGRASLFKMTFDHDLSKPKWTFKERARLTTCRVDREQFCGKPGVSICRFRDDGRLLALGGWDYRVRLFERSKGNAMAILKGSESSISCLDWSPDGSKSGLLASASESDNFISIWHCFPKDMTHLL